MTRKSIEWNTIREEEARSIPNTAPQILPKALEHGWHIISGKLPVWLRSLRIFNSDEIVDFPMESVSIDYKQVIR